MALQKVNALIVRAGQVLEQVERPLRRCPDGRLGVEYLGVVYPLHAGSADVAGDWYYPAQAPICLEAPSEPSGATAKDWLLDLDGYRPYVFMNGPPQIVPEVARRLEAAGFPPERWGPSFRQGAGGPAFEWFIRLPRRDDQDAPDEWLLGQIFSGVAAEKKDGAPGASDPDLAEEVRRLRARLVEAEAQLYEEVRARDAAEAASEELRRSFGREMARAKDSASFLRAALSRLEAAHDAQRDGQPPPSNSDLLSAALEAARREIEELLLQWQSSEEARQQAAEEIAELRARIAALKSADRPRSNRPSGRIKDWLRDLETTLAVFVPSVQLLRDSGEFIATEVADRSDLYRKLRSLDEDRTTLKAKRVQAADGWLELHFSTGLARDGRLYFNKQDGPSTRWLVLVSDKAAQQRDFSWIARQ